MCKRFSKREPLTRVVTGHCPCQKGWSGLMSDWWHEINPCLDDVQMIASLILKVAPIHWEFVKLFKKFRSRKVLDYNMAFINSQNWIHSILLKFHFVKQISSALTFMTHKLCVSSKVQVFILRSTLELDIVILTSLWFFCYNSLHPPETREIV